MNIYQTKVWKDWPGMSWPLWSNTLYFNPPGAFTWDNTRDWTADVGKYERLIHDTRINHRLIGVRQVDADTTGDAALAWYHPVIKGLPGEGLELANPCPWNVHLRVRHSDGIQRPGNHMYRGALSQEQVNMFPRNGIGLKAVAQIDTLIHAGLRKARGDMFDWLLIHHSNPIGPGFDWTSVEYMDVVGASVLNGQRRAMSKHLQGSVSTLAGVMEKLEQFYLQTDAWYRFWYLLDLPNFYPLGIKEQIMQAANNAASYCQLVEQFFNDIDPEYPEQEDDTGRFGITGATIIRMAGKLKTKHETWVEMVNHEQPFQFGPEFYWTNQQMKKFWDDINQWNKYMAPALFWDWMDSTRAREKSKVRGGYVPLHPEIDPSSGT